ncbi:MAG: hypothetical protein AAFR59_17475 [Bacteroidota bacterium]
MKKSSFTYATLILLRYCCFMLLAASSLSLLHAQTAQDVLYKSKRIKSQDFLFLKIQGETIEYAVGQSFNSIESPLRYETLADSALYLADESSVNVYMRPYNPLNYAIGSAYSSITDPINAEVQATISAIIGNVKLLADTEEPQVIDFIKAQVNLNMSINLLDAPEDSCAASEKTLKDLMDLLNKVNERSANDKKQEIIQPFTQ